MLLKIFLSYVGTLEVPNDSSIKGRWRFRLNFCLSDLTFHSITNLVIFLM